MKNSLVKRELKMVVVVEVTVMYIYFSISVFMSSVHWSDTVCWATGRACSL